LKNVKILFSAVIIMPEADPPLAEKGRFLIKESGK
jgi:hypothetical protein